jgi:catechol 2,3-dioxygenase-like lactoylglutathione lyase family enzyme
LSAEPFDAQKTFLYTRDLSRSSRCYEHVLGFKLAADQGSYRIYRIEIQRFEPADWDSS